MSLRQQEADFETDQADKCKHTDEEATSCNCANAHGGVPFFHARMRRRIDGATDTVPLEAQGPSNVMLRLRGAKCSDIGHDLPPFLFRQQRGDKWLHPCAWTAVFDNPKQFPVFPFFLKGTVREIAWRMG